MSRESEDLSTHVEICAIRYEGIQKQFTAVDERLDKIDSNLSEIKELIATSRAAKFNTMVTAAGTIMVALVGLLGYLITNAPK